MFSYVFNINAARLTEVQVNNDKFFLYIHMYTCVLT